MTQELEHFLEESELPSKLEVRVRALDDPRKPIKVMSEELAELFGENESTIKEYLVSKRNGYPTHRARVNSNAQKAGFTSESERRLSRNGLSSYKEYQDKQAQKAGWNSFAEYRKSRKMERVPSLSEGMGRGKRRRAQHESAIEIVPTEILDEIPVSQSQDELDAQETIYHILRTFPRRQQIILRVATQGVLPRVIGEQWGITQQRVNQLMEETYKAIWEELLPGVPYTPEREKNYVSDGELLFLKIISKAVPRGKKWRINEIKELYVEAWNKERSHDSIRYALYGPECKKRYQKIRDRVFSRE